MRFLAMALLALVWLVVACGDDAADRPAVVSSPTPSLGAASSQTGAAPPTATRTAEPVLPPAPELQVPPGFRATVFASGLNQPTAMAWGPDGRLYVTQAEEVVSVVAGDTAPAAVVTKLETPLGLAWIGQQLFISEMGRVTRVDFGARPATTKVIVDDLPFRRHQQNNIVAGADGRLYLGSGSTCDVCNERDKRSAAILSFKPDGSI